MKNKAFLGLFLLLMIALAPIGVEAISSGCIKGDPDVEIINPDTNITGNIGEVIQGSFTVENLRGYSLSKDFYASNLMDWNGVRYILSTLISFDPDPVYLLPSGQTNVDFNIDLTGTNAYATTYYGRIEIPKTGCADDSFAYNLTVLPSPSMTLEGASLTIAQGSSGSTTADADNTGNTDLTVSFSVTDLSLTTDPQTKILASQITIAPVSVIIDYEGSETITITVDVPATQKPGTYTGTLIANYGSGFAFSTLTVIVTSIGPSLSVSISANPTSGYEPLTVQFNSMVSGGVLPYTYSWTFGDSGTSLQANPTHEYISRGNYVANLVVTDSNLNTASDSININVLPSILQITNSPGEIEVSVGDSISTSYTVKNIGSINVTNAITSVSSGLEMFGLSFDPALFNLQINASQTVAINGVVPGNASGTYSGTVYVRGNEQGASTSFPLTIKIRGMLEITDFDAYVDGDSQKNLENGDKIKDVKPGSELKLNIQVKNMFDDDIDIDDIVVTAEIREIDDGDDLEEESDEFDLEAGDKERKTLVFDIPDDAEEDDYVLDITVEGEDDDGVEHRLEWQLTVELNREKHDIRINEAYTIPSIVSCTRRATLTIKLINLGEKDEDDVVLEIISNALDINQAYEFEMSADPDDDDNKVTKTFNLNVPDDLAAGTYSIDVDAYYNTDRLSDSKTVDLTVQECGISDEDDEEEEETELVYTTQIGGAVVMGEEAGFRASSVYSALLAIITIILIIVVISLIVRLVMKK